MRLDFEAVGTRSKGEKVAYARDFDAGSLMVWINALWYVADEG
jgi:hypothetical protein